MTHKRSCRGFSLLEVLVAFTILAMLLAALFQVFSAGLHAARSGDRYTRATVIAQSQIAALGVESPLQEGITSGTTDGSFSVLVGQHGVILVQAPLPLPWQDWPTPSNVMDLVAEVNAFCSSP